MIRFDVHMQVCWISVRKQTTENYGCFGGLKKVHSVLTLKGIKINKAFLQVC